jgi:hypothetical protein
MLVTWRPVEQLRCARLLLGVLEQRDQGGPLDETLFADRALLPVAGGTHWLSFLCWTRAVVHGAAADPSVEDCVMMRLAFLLALVYDARFQRFVLTPHRYLLEHLGVRPGHAQHTHEFVDAIRARAGDALERPEQQIPFCEEAIALWRDDYQFRASP